MYFNHATTGQGGGAGTFRYTHAARDRLHEHRRVLWGVLRVKLGVTRLGNETYAHGFSVVIVFGCTNVICPHLFVVCILFNLEISLNRFLKC